MATKKTNATGPKARLMKKNLTQLKAQAKKLKIKGFSTKKKDQLVQSILMAQARTKKSATPKKRISRSKIGTSFSMSGSRSKKRMVRKRGAAPNRTMKKPVRMAGRTMAGYNGWSNYETWLVNLHYDEYFQELADENPNMDAYELSQLYAEVVNDQVADTISHDNYFLSDMANAFLSAVDYREIAESKDE